MAGTFAGGTLRVTTPSSYDAKPASRTRTRDLSGGPEGGHQAGKDALVAALEDAGLAQVERVDVLDGAERTGVGGERVGIGPVGRVVVVGRNGRPSSLEDDPVADGTVAHEHLAGDVELLGHSYVGELAAFVETVRAGTPAVVGGYDARRALRVALAAIESQSTGTTVRLGKED